MKRHVFFSCIFLIANICSFTFRNEGVRAISFGETTDINTSIIGIFLRYNPTIVEIGGFEGAVSQEMALYKPHGNIYVFEPHPDSFHNLCRNVEKYPNVHPIQSAVDIYSKQIPLYTPKKLLSNKEQINKLREENINSLSSVLRSKGKNRHFLESAIAVPCTSLTSWCQKMNVNKIDVLLLDTMGSELRILKNSKPILDKTLLIVTKTNLFRFKPGTALFPEVNQFLQRNGFEMLAHIYFEDFQGRAYYLKKEVFDAYYR